MSANPITTIPHKGERRSSSPYRAAGYLGVAILFLAFAVHAYWAIGGEWAAATSYGSEDLPPQAVPAVVAVLIAAAALLLLMRIGALAAPLPASLLRAGPWMLAAVFALAAVSNLLAPQDSYARDWHVFFFGPLLLALASLCIVVARSPWPSNAGR